MEAFTVLTSIAVSLPEANIDTDIIFPARFLLLTQKKGLAKYAFHEKRFDEHGAEYPNHPLNRQPWSSANILIAGDNFGCGSSREQAPWALRDFGIRCVISTRFGEIFYSNCFQNGILPIVVGAPQLLALHADADHQGLLTIDLKNRRIVRANGEEIIFEIADWRREALLNGWDDIAIILNQEAGNIAAFEARQRQRMPWLYTSNAT